MSINFPKAEEEVIRYWREIDAFQTQLRLTKDGPHFTFYDGPPFGKLLDDSHRKRAVSSNL
jgi:isoleucyl-tRNA synthetase